MVLSNDQQYLYAICLAISRGECYSDMALRKPGPVSHSRWLTIAGRILRLYVVTEIPSDNLIILATYIMKVELDSVRDFFFKAAETRDDDWGEKIITRIKDQDLTAKDASYHLFCQRELYRLLSETGGKRGYRPARNVDEAMEYIYYYLDGKSEECQFSMEELLNQIQGGFYPDIQTVKTRLFKKYAENIMIAETCNQKCTVYFRNLGYKILTKSWYDNKKSDPQEEKLRAVKAASDIILGDISSQIYNTSEYTPPDNFLVNVESVFPDSLLVFFQTIILKNKCFSVDKWRNFSGT
ncbi:hypothetical protein AVEN_9372-1 [Araneus ventricosus]|uniref:Uncharacterized protein n=1 Tax=Araneus ventricosus TaxID=182803 RepID=A0A4Y2DKQ0_ARAVE|nr:hypothetical protein AVEN_9372-1 [Araneus ventricosus]